MKKRVIIGIICAILGLVVVFWLGPLVNTVTQETVEVIRLSRNVGQGSEITVSDLEVVDVNPSSIPSGIINDASQIVGKFAATDLHAGDYLYDAKLSDNGINADSVLASLDGKVAISVPITFQGSVSGKLENGDIIRFYIKRNGTDEFTYTPDSLMYVRVITTTTSGGIDQDQVNRNDDGSYEMPSTVTVLVTDEQARELASYASGYTLYLALIYRGDEDTAQSYIDMQDAILAGEGTEDGEPAVIADTPDLTEEEPATTNPIENEGLLEETYPESTDTPAEN